MFALYQAGMVFSPTWTWLYVAGWSGFNLMRAKCIGANDHPPLLAVEITILAGTVCMVGLLWDHGKPMMLAAVPFIATGLVWLTWSSASRACKKRAPSEAILEPETFRRGIEYGLANLTSAGLFFQLPILFSQSGDVEKAGLIGVLLSMVGVMDLVPASISAHFLPISARYAKGGDYASLDLHIKKQEKVLIAGLVALILAGIGVWAGLVSIGYPITDVSGANQSFAILLACYFSNHLSNPAANYLQAHERSDISIKINLATFTSFWCIYLLPLPESVVSKDLLPLIALLLPIAIRSAGMRWMVRRELAKRLALASEAR
jgi:O-antigen/teichoic acid export membrane protein